MAATMPAEPAGSLLPQATAIRPAVLRTISRWGLTAIVLNQIIGSGVFALPGTVAARLGWLVLPAHAVAALLALLIMLSFAEVASRFTQAGGPYLYAQVAFGRFVGLQMGWMAMFVRLLSAAVQVNLLTTYLADLWAPAGGPVGSALIAAAFLGGLTVVNLFGVAQGTRLSSLFAILKLAALLAFGVAGLAWMAGGHSVHAPVATAATPEGWLGVVLLLMFAYGGFEAALIPLGESQDPRRDAPWALLVGLAAVVVVYLFVQIAVLATLSNPGATDRPLATAGGVMFGRAGSLAMTLVAITSVYGWGSAIMVAAPRLSFAMAERGDLPAVFAWVHPRWRTPWVSILTYSGLVFLLSQQGGLLRNISLATVSRLLTYGLVCAALPVLRHREKTADTDIPPAAFRAPYGGVIAAASLVASLTLVTRMTSTEAAWLGGVSILAFSHWLGIRRPA
jgi:amino acid transporter